MTNPTPPASLLRFALLCTAPLSIAALTACSGITAGPSGSSPDQKSVLFLGDSIARTEAPALGAALTASGATLIDLTSDGGGSIVDPRPHSACS